jgi:hypothetical protein
MYIVIYLFGYSLDSYVLQSPAGGEEFQTIDFGCSWLKTVKSDLLNQ